MERETFIQKVTNHLNHTHQCHTIILYGSYQNYQNGDYTNESDVDLIGFSDVSDAENKVETFQGKLLDVWIHPTEEMNKSVQFLKVLEGEILLDERQQAKAFLEKIDAIYQAGPRKLAGKEKQFLKDWLIKMKVRSRKGDMEGRYRFYWLIKESLEIYFEMNGRWYLGPKKSLNWLAENDVEGYRKYDKLLEGPGDRRRLDAWIDHLQKL